MTSLFGRLNRIEATFPTKLLWNTKHLAFPNPSTVDELNYDVLSDALATKSLFVIKVN